MKPRGSRRDAVLVKGKEDITGLFPYLMKRRCDSVVYFSQVIDMEPLFSFIEKERAAGREIGFYPFFVAALVRLFRERYKLNRYVKGRRLYQRDAVDIAMVAKRDMTEASAETIVKLRFKKEALLQDILAKLRGEVRIAKSDEVKEDDKFFTFLMKLPRCFLMAFVRVLELMDFYRGIPKDLEAIDPMRCSVFVANLGSIGIDAPFHHLYEWGTCSVFIAIGRIKKTPLVLEDGTLAVHRAVEIKVTLDERLADGFYYARSLDIFKTYFEKPEELERSLRAGV